MLSVYQRLWSVRLIKQVDTVECYMAYTDRYTAKTKPISDI